MTKRVFEEGESVRLRHDGRSVTGTIVGEPSYMVWIPDYAEGHNVSRAASLLTAVPKTGEGPFRTPPSPDELTTLERMNEVKAPESSRDESLGALLERGRQSQIAIREQFERLSAAAPKPPSPAEALSALRMTLAWVPPGTRSQLELRAEALLVGMGSSSACPEQAVLEAFHRAAAVLYVEGHMPSPYLDAIKPFHEDDEGP